MVHGLLVAVASLLVEHGPEGVGSESWHTGLVVPRHMGSSQTRDQTCVPCIGRRILTTGRPGKSPKETVYKLEPPSIVTHVAKYLQVPFVCYMEALISHFAIKKKKRFREVKSHRSQSSCIPGSKIDAHNHYTCHIASHCTPKQRALFVFLIKHSSNTGDYLSLVTMTVSC